MKILYCIGVFLLLVSQVSALGILGLYCYRCVSNEPGCSTPFNWLWHWGWQCPEYDDKCVKIIERKGAETVITRECLSQIQTFRTDVPADHYEGCRPAATDVKLANYVNNSIKELDVKRLGNKNLQMNYYDSTTYCFCYFDNRCNGASSVRLSLFSLIPLAGFATSATWLSSFL